MSPTRVRSGFAATALSVIWMSVSGISLISNSAMASELETVDFQAIDDLQESLLPIRPVSGDVFIGFQGDSLGSIEPFRVTGWVPTLWSGQLVCVLLRSRDGRYEAYRTFEVPELTVPLFYDFDFDDAKEKTFLIKEAEQLASVVQLGECGIDSTQSSLSFWGGPSEISQEKITVLLNSRRADEVTLYFFDDSKEYTCRPIDAADRQVFDYYCDVESVNSGRRVEVNQIRRGNFDDPIEHILFFPSNEQ